MTSWSYITQDPLNSSDQENVATIFLNVIIMNGYDHVWFKTHNILCVINSCGLNFFYDENLKNLKLCVLYQYVF